MSSGQFRAAQVDHKNGFKSYSSVESRYCTTIWYISHEMSRKSCKNFLCFLEPAPAMFPICAATSIWLKYTEYSKVSLKMNMATGFCQAQKVCHWPLVECYKRSVTSSYGWAHLPTSYLVKGHDAISLWTSLWCSLQYARQVVGMWYFLWSRITSLVPLTCIKNNLSDERRFEAKPRELPMSNQTIVSVHKAILYVHKAILYIHKAVLYVHQAMSVQSSYTLRTSGFTVRTSGDRTFGYIVRTSGHTVR